MKYAHIVIGIVLVFVGCVQQFAFSEEKPLLVALLSNDTIDVLKIGAIEGTKVNFNTLRGDTIVTIDSIVSISNQNATSMWKSAGVGTIIGAGAGAILGYASYHKSTGNSLDLGPLISVLGGGILGGGCGFLVGSLVGLGSNTGREYNFQDKNLEEKMTLLREVRLNELLNAE